MDCRDAQFYLRLRRHAADELGPDVTADLDRHVTGCPGCAADARSAGRFDQAVAVAMRNVPLPPGLRDRLVAKLSAQRGSVLRRRAYQYAAAAAAVLLAVGLGYGAVWQSRPKADTAKLLMERDELVTNPQTAEDAVRSWLAAEDLPDRLPEPFDYRYYDIHGKTPIQGRDVPFVRFRVIGETGMPETATVYAYRKSHFDLAGVQDAQASHHQAKKYPAGLSVTFVVVSTTPDLKPFLKRGQQG
ncbi:MAG: hypothetical protein K2P78_06480 [Gemmataceae bacterium]|nr:hypothetical protein [Gemmataceae bacterium]